MGSRVARAPPPPGRSYAGEVELAINGKHYKVSDNVPGDTSLNSFIRDFAHLKGTKFMCREGGCGACIVSVQSMDPSTHQKRNYAVNSCLVPIFACDGWEVTTVEGLGSKSKGYHLVQKRLAAASGTQCGYCTGGMVMAMYCLLKQNPEITMKEVEDSFGGNICRCTGYRPILDAFKSLAHDAPKELIGKLTDIEDMVCPTSGKMCTKVCGQECHREEETVPPEMLKLPLVFSLKDSSGHWYRPNTVMEVFEIFDMIGSDEEYRLIAGDTAKGVYRIEKEPSAYIDINHISELHNIQVSTDGIELGANVNLTQAMKLFYRLAKKHLRNFDYCKTMADHINLVASVPVRNIGTLAGNLSLKHEYRQFPSDIFLILEMVGAQLVIRENSGEERTVSLMEYLDMDMHRKLIIKIILPNLHDGSFITCSYKIMPRAQNAHAYVNAAFMIKADKNDGYRIEGKPTILFGGIEPDFVHATKTEEYLTGKKLLDEKTLEGALEHLESELKPDHVLPDASPAFRKDLALSLFYKFFLNVGGESVNPKYRSGGKLLERPLSSGSQEFDTDRNIWPLNKPIPKIEALIQCAGEAEYTNDMPSFPGELWAQLVLCDRAVAEIIKIDPSESLKMEGVVAFLSAKDIPGKNNFAPKGISNLEDEVVFAEGKTEYAGQAVGVILAESYPLAIKAAKMVKIIYGKMGKPMFHAEEIIDNNVTPRIKEYSRIDRQQEKHDVKYKVKGRWDVKSQYHYTMETQTCIAVPTEDCLDLYPASQWPTLATDAVSNVTGIPEHKINVRVRRLGGAYGAKLSRSNHTASVAALAASVLGKPVRLVLDIETNMQWTGKRFPVVADYEVRVNENGEIQWMDVQVYEDDGHTPNDSSIGVLLHHLPNCYDSSTWQVVGYGVRTDNASHTWCRAPGSTEAICLIETIMEHIARVVQKDPVSVRLTNMKNTGKEENPVPTMIEDMEHKSDYANRLTAIEEFNKNNRWKKRGMSLVPMNYPFDYFGNFYAMVSIYYYDGTVAITHGGIEMGQGLNTKAAQVAAYILGVDLEMISLKPTTTLTAPNNAPTGGSIGSEAVAYAVKECCEELNRRLEPIKKKLGEKATWFEIIEGASQETINLNASYMFTPKDKVKSYPIYGVTVTEIELDILTGQFQLVRVDLMEDAGQSLSPEVDIGQVEGAFVMGLGYYTSEELKYHPLTGKLLTDRTWNYKPPGAKDIPVDFRVTLRRNSTNPVGVLRSKATGEPPFCMSCVILFAIRNALEAARMDTCESHEDWFKIDHPYTTAEIQQRTLTTRRMFKLF